MITPKTGETVVAHKRIPTNTPGYYTIPGATYKITRLYSESIEIRGTFTNKSGFNKYVDRMHSIPRSHFTQQMMLAIR